MNKICTSQEQSKKLVELGIDIHTADIIEKKRHKYIKGDIVRNRYTKKLSLVTEVFDDSFLLADTIIPQFGYKAQVSISPIYEFVRHLNKKEFIEKMSR